MMCAVPALHSTALLIFYIASAFCHPKHSQTFRDDTSLIMDATSEILRLTDKVAHVPALRLSQAHVTQIMQAVQVCTSGVMVIHPQLHSHRVDIEKKQDETAMPG